MAEPASNTEKTAEQLEEEAAAAAAAAAAAESTAKPKAPRAPRKPVKVSVRAVHGGPMVNPLTEDSFIGEPSKPVLLDDWLDVQIAAGKIAVVED